VLTQLRTTPPWYRKIAEGNQLVQDGRHFCTAQVRNWPEAGVAILVLAHPQLRQLRTCHSPSSNNVTPRPPLGGRAAGGRDGEIASTNDQPEQAVIVVMLHPTGWLRITLFCPSSAKWPIVGPSSQWYFFVSELPSGVADSP
jgi:hypothetical protein